MPLNFYSDEEIDAAIERDKTASVLDITKPIDFVLDTAKTEFKYSKSNNPMIMLALIPLANDKEYYAVIDYLLPESDIGLCRKNVSSFIKAIGLYDEWKAGKLPGTTQELLTYLLSKTRRGKFMLERQSYTKKDGNEGYKYVVLSYIEAKKPTTDPDLNDDIPF